MTAPLLALVARGPDLIIEPVALPQPPGLLAVVPLTAGELRGMTDGGRRAELEAARYRRRVESIRDGILAARARDDEHVIEVEELIEERGLVRRWVVRLAVPGERGAQHVPGRWGERLEAVRVMRWICGEPSSGASSATPNRQPGQ